MDDVSDTQLVRDVLAGDVSAYGRLYDRYARLVGAVCHDTTRDISTAHDLCQETFLRAYRNLRNLREPDAFAGWVVGTARFVCREWVRSRRRDRHEFVEHVPDRASDPARLDPDAADEATQLLLAITDLPEVERTALHLFYLQENPADAARAVLGLSKSGFYRVLERARQRLKQKLTERAEVTDHEHRK